MSNHAETRAKQHGVRKASVRKLMEWADFEVPVGGGCVAIRLGREKCVNSDVRLDLQGAMDRLRVCNSGQIGCELRFSLF